MPIRATGGPRRSRRTPVAARLLAALSALALATTLAGCRSDATPQGSNVDPSQVDATAPPETGECRMLTPSDIDQPSNATRAVPCEDPHTAETFATGDLPASFDDVDYDDERLAGFAYSRCGKEFMDFLGVDESLAMRSLLSWTMFRPSRTAWRDGARWYRCDVVGGGASSKTLLALPERTKGLMRKPDDGWMACVKGTSVDGAPRVPCTQRHTFRAVTTIKLGDAEDDYPGDEVVAERTRSFCGDSVGAWLGYPARYAFGYTWFGLADWDAGNRRSVCWARTDQ